jgi:hypothetical protein
MDYLKLAQIQGGRKSGRVSSWDTSGRNDDYWIIQPGERRLLADLEGPGNISHIWMTQHNHYRHCLLLVTWDDAAEPSIAVPLGDFFCLGNGLVNSFQSALFTASTAGNHRFEQGCALNCYVQMPFRRRARVELLNEAAEPHLQYFYVDYERWPEWPDGLGYFHAEFRRANPFSGWGAAIPVNSPASNVANAGEVAWANNYVILDTQGEGHYIGCNLSVANFDGGWWGEGDDMIWVDGYKWPPDLHGTGSEDYLGQAWGMQNNAFLRNGSSIYERASGGYQSSYVFHLENPVRFTTSIRVTIEHGHANHLANDMASVGYWYAREPAAAVPPPPVAQRLPVARDNQGHWLKEQASQTPPAALRLTEEMMKAQSGPGRA